MRRADFAEIPLIDIAALRTGARDGVDAVAARIVAACESAGFFYVTGHGVSDSTISGVFEAARWFFASPQPMRDALDVKTSPNFRGYVPIGTVGPMKPRRMLEAFQMMLDLSPDDPDVRAGNIMAGPNRWPDDAPLFRAAMEDYFVAMMDLTRLLLAAFARGLGLPGDFFLAHFIKPLTQLRLLHYPPQPPDSDAEGVEAHTDTGAFTILLQDDVGGLEVKTRAGRWIAARPIPGSFVVNIADMLQRWTNGRFISTPHRVRNRTGRDRISVPFFANPDYGAVISPIAGDGPSGGTSYAPLACGPYVEAAYRAAWGRTRRGSDDPAGPQAPSGIAVESRRYRPVCAAAAAASTSARRGNGATAP
jgi:isopenicillin N synthase-like dioxygenase